MFGGKKELEKKIVKLEDTIAKLDLRLKIEVKSFESKIQTLRGQVATIATELAEGFECVMRRRRPVAP